MSTPKAAAAAPGPSDMAQRFVIRPAVPADAPALEQLINAAFRDDPTTDVYLTPDHARIDLVSVDGVLQSMSTPDVVVFVGTDPASPGADGGEIVGHFSLRRKVQFAPPATTAEKQTTRTTATTTTTAWLALLAVSPSHQGRGHGGALLAHAEAFARVEWGADRLEFDVVNTRSALRAWYAARGYAPTTAGHGEKPFAYEHHPGWEGVLRGDLAFVDYGRDLC
ncbi:[ribosomal protein S18]-alanine N-acetyltransferase [Microdochium nivale]|nr:[ribosomal protein S18]-alanine N-acetyltransferase [Microdochium nivale]